MNGDLIYTDGTLKVIVKRRYAYYYNLKGVPYGRAEVNPYLFTLLDQTGFKRTDQKEQCKHDRLYKSIVGKWFHCRDCGEYWSD